MEVGKKNGYKSKKGIEIIAKIFFVFARFSWFFGIIIAIIILVSMYRLLIQPQYQQILASRVEVEKLNFEGEKDSLHTHLKRLHAFIELSRAITDEDKNHLNNLLQEVPDILTLQIQLERLLKSYDLETWDVTLGEPQFLVQEEDASVAVEVRDRFVDLGGLFDKPAVQEEVVVGEEKLKEIVLGTIPVDFTIDFPDYFAMKDFIKALENTVPIIDITSITVAVSIDDVATPDESIIVVPTDEDNAGGQETQSNTVHATLSGVLRIGMEQ